MSDRNERVRVLYSFPNRLGASRICYTAWQQVNGLAEAGADLLVLPGAISRPAPAGVRVSPTRARGKLRLPVQELRHHAHCCIARPYCGPPAREARGQDRRHSYLAPGSARSTEDNQKDWEVQRCWKNRNTPLRALPWR